MNDSQIIAKIGEFFDQKQISKNGVAIVTVHKNRTGEFRFVIFLEWS